MKNSLNKTNLLLLRLSMYTHTHTHTHTHTQSSGNRQLSVWRKSKTTANNEKFHAVFCTAGNHHTVWRVNSAISQTDEAPIRSKQLRKTEEKGENWEQWQSLSPVSKMSFLKMAVRRGRGKSFYHQSTGKEKTHSLSQGRWLPSSCSLAQRPLKVMRGIGAGLGAEPWACDPGNVID